MAGKEESIPMGEDPEKVMLIKSLIICNIIKLIDWIEYYQKETIYGIARMDRPILGYIVCYAHYTGPLLTNR